MDIISLNPNVELKFYASKEGHNSMPYAILEITNKSSTYNAAFKVKTTAPKLFVVQIVKGIIAPKKTLSVKINQKLDSDLNKVN